MRLRVFLPTSILVDREVRKVSAESAEGAFTLLPRHIDFAAILAAGLLAYEDEDGAETFLAVDEGTIVKQGREVRVSTQDAVMGEDLESLRDTVDRQFRQLDERQRRARGALSRIELDLARRFYEMQTHEWE